MSDAIVLDVLSSSPVQLDVGDADPIAREEIAALATRVTTVEGDVSALDGRMDTAEGDISTLGTTVDGINARVEAIEADYVTSEDVMDALGGEAPALVSGSSRAILGDPETASWTERTTAADGAALIEAVYGNTVVESGSLLPVRIEGIETVGFNQWDEVWELGIYDRDTGQPVASNYSIRSKNRFGVIGGRDYYCNNNYIRLLFYDASDDYISSVSGIGIKQAPNNARYGRIYLADTYGTTYNHDICINISDPARNGEYEPHWSSQRTIPAATYFPQGMRSAGTVYDELTETQAITRVGAVDLGTLGWTYLSDYSAFFSTGLPIVKSGYTNSSVAPMTCSKYETVSFYTNGAYFGGADKVIAFAFSSGQRLYIKDTSLGTDAAAFKTAMSGVMLHYALATPTTTPIDPPLALSYRTGAGGTERVMVAEGTTSAPPIFATRYPLDPADLAASIAPRESATAEANHAVGDLVMLGWTLCRVTTAIARGEAITIGTNVTKTSVAAEIAALS